MPTGHITATWETTRTDLDWWIEKIPTLDWTFAIRYASTAPHEYVSERTAGMTAVDFVRAARVIHTLGEPQKFFATTRIYLVHGGWKYWTMDRLHDDVRLINRARADHVYGVQNMPRTASSIDSPYDRLGATWDAHFAASGGERARLLGICSEVTGSRSTLRTLDIGAGTGATLDLGITEAPRMTAVDPSQAMLNELVRKHPTVARVEPTTLAMVRAERRFAGTTFDLVVALGGSASYLTPDDWAALDTLGRDRFVLTVYSEGCHPPTDDLTDEELASARIAARRFAEDHEGKYTRVGEFDVVAVRPRR